MSIFAQQRVDVCLQFRSKFNVSVLCAFTYVLLLQDCVCVCVYLTCVCQIFFSSLSIAAMQMCLTGRDTERNAVQGGHVEGVTWPCVIAGGLVNWLQTTILSLCVSVCECVVKKKNSTVSAFFAQCDWAIWDWEWKVFCVLYCLKLNLSNGMLLVRRIASRLFL